MISTEEAKRILDAAEMIYSADEMADTIRRMAADYVRAVRSISACSERNAWWGDVCWTAPTAIEISTRF